jgi:hypothetical protein
MFRLSHCECEIRKTMKIYFRLNVARTLIQNKPKLKIIFENFIQVQ